MRGVASGVLENSPFDFMIRPYIFCLDFELGDLGLVRKIEKFKTHCWEDDPFDATINIEKSKDQILDGV